MLNIIFNSYIINKYILKNIYFYKFIKYLLYTTINYYNNDNNIILN
jgi:hypothetical protein